MNVKISNSSNSIYNSSVASTTSPKTSQKADTENIMAVAIKAYKDELLTGLTDEEREEIEKKISEYVKALPENVPIDRQNLNSFIKGLLLQYGFKGDCDEYAAVFGANVTKESAQNHASSITAFNKNFSSSIPFRTKLE